MVYLQNYENIVNFGVWPEGLQKKFLTNVMMHSVIKYIFFYLISTLTSMPGMFITN
jgi:hypothetical protein